MLLDDTLAGYETLARAACTGLADRLTSRVIALVAPGAETSWLDIAIQESESQRDPKVRAEVVVTTTITVSVRDAETGFGQRLANWIGENAYTRLLQESTLKTALYGRIQSGTVTPGASDISGTVVVYIQRTVRSVLPNYKIDPAPEVVGITTRIDVGAESPEGAATGRAALATAAAIVSWVSPGLVLGPVAAVVMHAGAAPADEIDVLDALGVVVESLPVATFPTGTVTTSALPAGEYRARLNGVLTGLTLSVTERPVL